MKRRFKVIIFDLDRTLVDIPRRAAYRKLISLLVRKRLLSKSKERAAFRKLLYIDKKFEKLFRFLEFAKSYFKGYERMARKIDYLYQFIDIGKYRLFPKTKKVLALLYRKYPLYLVSYGKRSLQNKKINITRIRKYFKDVFITEVDNKKPLIERVYRIEKKRNPKLKKSEVLMVGDSLTSDILAAKRAGVSSVLIDYYKNYIDKTNIPSSFRINKISEIFGVLD